MSESAAKRQPIDLDEFERRLRGPSPAVRSDEDPLAELARLVNMGSPFGQARNAPPVEPPAPPPAPQLRVVEPQLPHEPAFEPEYRAVEPPMEQPAAYPRQPDEPYFEASPGLRGSVQEPAVDFGRLEEDMQRYAAPVEPASTPVTRPAAARDWADDYNAPPPPTFREAARLDDEALSAPPVYMAEEPAPARNPRRTIYLASAGLMVVLAAVAITLVVRGGTKTGGEPPTILAATGPVKVQPSNPGGADLASQSSSVLDKNQVDRVNASKVVTREEQPVDLATAPPAPARPQQVVPLARPDQPFNTGAPVQVAPPSVTGATGFPEPKRVKTVSVRPDGSVISGEASPAPTPARPSIAAVPPNPSAAKPPATPAAPKPAAAAPAATPKATARVANVSPQDGDGATGTPGDARAPSIRTSTAKPSPATSGSGGYAVQLAAPPSEQEAKATAARLQSKYAGQLGSYRPGIVKATVGDKTIYRVRVSGLSKDDAAKLCTSIQSGGGACFVAKS